MENYQVRKEKISRGLTSRFKLFFSKEYWHSRTVLWLLISSIVGNLVNWIIILIYVRPTVPTIILHYNVYFGVDMMGNWGWVFILPGIGLFLLIINNSLAIYFYGNLERIASYILLIAALMVQLSLLIATLSVIIINY